MKELLAHLNPYMSREDLIDYIAEIALDKLDPRRKAQRAEKRALALAKKTLAGPAAVATSGKVPTTNSIPAQELVVTKLPKLNPENPGLATTLVSEFNARLDLVPAQELPVKLQMYDQPVGSLGEIQMAVNFGALRSGDIRIVRSGVVGYEVGPALLDQVSVTSRAKFRGSSSRSRRRFGCPSVRGLAFRRPAEKAASLGF